nr:MAG TPA: hypothetical protein [Caudoviricetes sp.]
MLQCGLIVHIIESGGGGAHLPPLFSERVNSSDILRF